MSKEIIGVLGGGSFGTAVSNLLAANNDVLMYVRRQEVADKINSTRKHRNQTIAENITAVTDIQQVCESCHIIFPVIPGYGFRKAIQAAAPYLKPSHILIHATKGLDVSVDIVNEPDKISRKTIKTMSEVILEETSVIRIGCMAGPNLAREISEGQPAAAVTASNFKEVVKEGKRVLRSSKFQIYGSKDIRGVELTGVLKNYIAIASGAVSGLNYGANVRSLLITRGMGEMIYIGKAFGANAASFLGVAGVGDLVATCTSTLSRNFTVGRRLAEGETLEHIIKDMEEVAEGVNTIRIIKALCDQNNIQAPIVQVLHKILYGDLDVQRGVELLMRVPSFDDAEYVIAD